MKEKEKKPAETVDVNRKGMEDTLKESFEHPMLQLLIGNPALIGILDDVRRGKDLDSAIGRNMKEWQKRREIGDLPTEIGDDEERSKVKQMLQAVIDGGDLQTMSEMMVKGMKFDEAVAAARDEGYLKGKNEKIEIMRAQHVTGADERGREDERAAQFPTYRRKSVWDREQ